MLRRLSATKLTLGLIFLVVAVLAAGPASALQAAPVLLALALSVSGLVLLPAGFHHGRSGPWRLASLALDVGAIVFLLSPSQAGAPALHPPLPLVLPAWWDAAWTPLLVVAAIVLNGAAAPAELAIAAAGAGLAAGWYLGWLLPAAAAGACVVVTAAIMAPLRRRSLPPDLPDRLAHAAAHGNGDGGAGTAEGASLGKADLQAAAAALGVGEVGLLVHDTLWRQRAPTGDLHLLRGGRYTVQRVPLDPGRVHDPTVIGFESPPGPELPALSYVKLLVGQVGVVGRIILPSWPELDTNRPEHSAARDALLALLAATWGLRLDNQRLARQAEAHLLDIVESLIASVEAKDQYTSGHSTRVCKYSLALGEALGLTGRKLDEVSIGAALHDVGKLGVPEQILSKPGALDDAEWSVVRSHPKVGARIIDSFNQSEAVLHIIYHHHERYDGRGYPAQLKGEAIPFPARIVAVADALDAMTSSRSYQRNRTVREAVDEVRRNAGTQFDPKMVQALVKIPLAKLEAIAPYPPAEATTVPAAKTPVTVPA